MQGAAGGCRNAFETSTARGGHKHARSVRGRRRGDGQRCGDDSGGFRRRIGRMVKEERPREDSTSWSFACVKIVMAGDGEREGERIFCVTSVRKVSIIK